MGQICISTSPVSSITPLATTAAAAASAVAISTSPLDLNVSPLNLNYMTTDDIRNKRLQQLSEMYKSLHQSGLLPYQDYEPHDMKLPKQYICSIHSSPNDQLDTLPVYEEHIVSETSLPQFIPGLSHASLAPGLSHASLAPELNNNNDLTRQVHVPPILSWMSRHNHQNQSNMNEV
jgi:hypothetical protein